MAGCSALTCWLAATASVRPRVRPSRPKCSRLCGLLHLARHSQRAGFGAGHARQPWYFTFFLPEGQQIVGYPISGLDNDLRPGSRRYYFIWYRVCDAHELEEMCVDEEGLLRAAAIAPSTSCASSSPSARRSTISPRAPDIWPVVLVSDAATTARPHMGFRVAKAGCDALGLSKP